jgi:F-type H+-transporting ATPase subunit b
MPLQLDWATIIFEIVNFLALLALLYWLVFRPVTERVRRRAEEKERILHEADQERRQAAEAREQVERRLANVDEDAAEIVTRGRENAQEERQAVLDEAEREAREIHRQAEVDAKRLMRQTLSDFHDHLRDTILDISGQLIRNVAPDKLQIEMVQALNDRVWQMGQKDMQRVEMIRRSLGERSPTAEVVTAKPLSSDQQATLVRTFSALADRNVGLQQQVDPALYVGLRVRLGDVVTDHSIAGQLDALRERVDRLLEDSREALLRYENLELSFGAGSDSEPPAQEDEHAGA